MELNKFTCSNGHLFFVPLHLPKPLSVVGKMLEAIRCPICQTDKNHMYFDKKYTVIIEDEEKGEIEE